jgi:xanthine dehydrogenase accessory factor
MDHATLHDRETELRSSRVPFVRAQVVLAERPTSAKPGAEALVLGDGTIEGFVGGDCAESTVREQSLALLKSGETRLVRITPDAEGEQAGRVVVHNPCLSGGTLEIFLEPVLPAPGLVVAGTSPIAEALAQLAENVGYQPQSFEGQFASDTVAVVVASHGRDDEEKVLAEALRAGVGYVGLVASPARGAAVVAALDVDADQRARVHTPAGLDIGARSPHEIALSILAEIISERPQPAAVPPAQLPVVSAPTATDPVCGMSVEMIETSPHLDHEGTRVWFCCHGCRRAFAADPGSYTA